MTRHYPQPMESCDSSSWWGFAMLGKTYGRLRSLGSCILMTPGLDGVLG